MSVLITSITELSQKFFNSDPLEFDEYFAITPDYQKYCLDANLLSRFTVAVAKEAMLVHDIAIHLLAGGCKLATGGVKGVCAIASGIFGLEPDHQTPSKQAVVHLGFVSLYAIDILASITNINNAYPQHLVDKIKNIFVKFLETPNKEATIQYIIDPETEEALKKKEAEAQAKDLALKEEQEKVKEKEELLRRTQEELEHTRNSEFISEEEIEKMFKEAHEAADEEVNNSYSKRRKQVVRATSPILGNKVTSNPSSYKRAFDDWTDDEDLVSFSSTQEDDSWLTNEAEILRKAKSIEEALHLTIPLTEQVLESITIDPPAITVNEPIIPEEKKVIFQRKPTLDAKAPTHSTTNSSHTPVVSALDRRLKYSENIRRRKKTAS